MTTKGMAAVHDNLVRQTVESVTDEIGRIIVERQQLRAERASHATLERNRRRLADAQAQLSLLLIERHLGGPSAV